NPKEKDPQAKGALDVEASENVIHGRSQFLHLFAKEPADQVEQEVRAFFRLWSWKEKANLFGPSGDMVLLNDKPFPADKPLQLPGDWKKFWNADSSPEILGRPRFQGGMFRPRIPRRCIR